jgi:hypothetical protein
MAAKDPHDAFSRLRDSMMLEKIKQARASGFAGISDDMKKNLEDDEREIASRYLPDDLNRMRKHGFAGVPIEQRATLTGHETTYSIMYRNFSRNIHSTDYVESYLKSGIFNVEDQAEYFASRDVAAHYTAYFSAVGIAEVVNKMFSLGFDPKLNELRQRYNEIRNL